MKSNYPPSERSALAARFLYTEKFSQTSRLLAFRPISFYNSLNKLLGAIMARINLTKDEKRDIKAALKGLKAAQRRAMKSSNPITMVVDDQLIRRDAAGEITVLETIPSVKVTVSFKRSRHREN